jgi:hypothetical protein
VFGAVVHHFRCSCILGDPRLIQFRSRSRSIAFGGALFVARSAFAQEAPPPAAAPAAPAAPAADEPPPSADEPAPSADESPAAAHPAPSVEAAQDFDALEAAVGAAPAPAPLPERSAARGAAIIQPEIALILDVAAAYFSDEPIEGGAHDPNHTGFTFQQLELAAGAAVDPYFRFDTNLVFAPFGVEVEEAYATTLSLPAQLQVRVGQFLSRFGRLNATHPHSWDFADQPFALTRVFGAEGGRGLGAEVSWLLPLDWHVQLSTSVTEAAGEGTARSFYGGRDLGVDSPKDLLYTTALEQFFALSNAWSLAAGLSGAFGPNSSGRDNHTDVYGADLYLKYRPIDEPDPTVVSLHAEWLYRRRQVPDDLLTDHNAFVQGSWRFAQRWATALRYEYGSPAFGESGDVVVDPLDPEWTRTRQRLSAALSFYPTEFSRLRLQGNHDLPRYRDAISSLFLAAEVLIGAHGAHSF